MSQSDPVLIRVDGFPVHFSQAKKWVPGLSRSTLYRWAKDGIDNPAAAELIRLHATGRVMPALRSWREFSFDRDFNLRTPSGHAMHPAQIEQFGWTQGLWCRAVDSLAEISDSLKEIRGEPRNPLKAVNSQQQT